MTTDPINDEILRIKRELAGRFDNDLDRIIADTKLRERNTSNYPPRRITAKQFFKIHNESLGWLGRIAKQKPQ